MAQTVKRLTTMECSIPGLGRLPGEGSGNPLQYSCLENAMDGGAWWATVHGTTELDTAERLPWHTVGYHVLPPGPRLVSHTLASSRPGCVGEDH